MMNTGKLDQECQVGQFTTVRMEEDLPTIFPMQYRNGRLSFVAETTARKGKKLVSSADHLVELLGGWRIQQPGKTVEATT